MTDNAFTKKLNNHCFINAWRRSCNTFSDTTQNLLNIKTLNPCKWVHGFLGIKPCHRYVNQSFLYKHGNFCTSYLQPPSGRGSKKTLTPNFEMAVGAVPGLLWRSFSIMVRFFPKLFQYLGKIVFILTFVLSLPYIELKTDFKYAHWFMCYVQRFKTLLGNLHWMVQSKCLAVYM